MSSTGTTAAIGGAVAAVSNSGDGMSWGVILFLVVIFGLLALVVNIDKIKKWLDEKYPDL